MPTDNTGVQTRAMAQRTDSEPQETQNENVNPTVELYKSKDESIKDFVRKHGTIALDWYVPNFSNSRVGDLIEQRLPIQTADGRIVFSCPTLSEFFRTSNFELDLKTGQVFTYLSPPENIGIACQKDPFDPDFLRNMLWEEQDINMAQEESLERIPNIKKLAGPADTMSLEETEQKIRQFCHLWHLYADTSVELKKKSELSQNIQIAAHEPLVTFNHRYEAIHKVAFGIPTRQQENKTVLIEYAKKLPSNTRDKLLRKLAKKNSYIKMLDDAFRQAIDINKESSFVEAATGRSNDQANTRIDTQVNELKDSFQDYDINAMSTRANNRSGDRSWNNSFDKPPQKNNSFNSSYSSRSNYRDNNYSSSEDSQNRQGFQRDYTRSKGYQQTPRYDQRNQHYQYRYDNNQDRNRFDNKRRPNKYQHHRNQHKAQIIFEFSDQNMMEMMQMVRGFINLIKANPTTRDHYKTNKLASR